MLHAKQGTEVVAVVTAPDKALCLTAVKSHLLSFHELRVVPDCPVVGDRDRHAAHQVVHGVDGPEICQHVVIHAESAQKPGHRVAGQLTALIPGFPEHITMGSVTFRPLVSPAKV